MLLLAAVLGLPAGLPARAATNMLKNAGFENGDADWDTGLEVFSIKAPAHSGSAAMYLESLSRATIEQCINISQSDWDSWITVKGHKFLLADGWIKTDQYVDLAYMEIWTWTGSDCVGAGNHWISNVVAGSQNWTKISEVPNANNNTFGLIDKPVSISVVLVVEPVQGANGTAAFDDLSVVNAMPGAVTLSRFTGSSQPPVGAAWLALGAIFLAVACWKLRRLPRR